MVAIDNDVQGEFRPKSGDKHCQDPEVVQPDTPTGDSASSAIRCSTEKGQKCPVQNNKGSDQPRPMTLWKYLVLQLTAVNNDLLNDTGIEGLLNMVRTPVNLERAVLFGVLVCLDMYLSVFTILPLRLCIAVYKLLSGRLKSVTRKGDLVKGLTLTLVLCLMTRLDISRIYHNIRGQAVIKLYVMFNVLEVADKLFSAIGPDIIELALSLATLASPVRTGIASLVLLVYTGLHSFVVLYHVIALNVAVNSYSNALLTLLLSNQFSEIKSSVFKKFDRENLFQLTCADIMERFQLLITLLVVGARNIVEVSDSGTIPSSWEGWNRWLGALFGPAVVVVGSEIVVDSLKHSYVVKFNEIKPEVYQRFLDILSVDYTTNSYTQESVVSKRTGLSVYPLAVVSFLMLLQSYGLMTKRSMERQVITAASSSKGNIVDRLFDGQWLSMVAIFVILFMTLLLIKLVLGIFLLQYASKRHVAAIARGASQNALRADALPPKQQQQSAIDLSAVSRFKMVAKRIW
jgi:lipoprotein signal peptidase